MKSAKPNTLGVVVGRFQLPLPHQGQLHLINYAIEHNEAVLVLCGYNARWPHVRDLKREPFPLEIQKQIISFCFPDVLVDGIPDSPISTEHWSFMLDTIVNGVAQGKSATLYGSRDSFITSYSGRFETFEVPPVGNLSATAARAELTKMIPDDPTFRLGWMAAMTRFAESSVQ